jgi:hypothetical protein
MAGAAQGARAANLSGLYPVQSENRAAIRLLPEIIGACRTVARAQTEGRAGQ